MLPRSMGRLLKLYSWEPVFPRIEWGFHIQPPYEWEIESLKQELVEKDGHWIIYGSKGKPVKGTCNGTPYSAIIYWLYLGDELDSVHKIRTTCSEKHCLNPEHLTTDSQETTESVDSHDSYVVNYSQGPPVYVHKNKTRRVPKVGDTERRMKCITRKVWFPDEGSALKAITYPRMRAYKCNMCSGWHHTHKNKKSSKDIKRKNRKMPYS